MSELLDLSATADELGVHYQTAYGWVRSGRLPSRMVAGRYRLRRSDLDSFTRDRTRPRSPRPPSRKRLETAAERMHEALSTGDEKGSVSLARPIVDDGTPVVELIERVLVPPLRRIGQDWHDGKVSIWVEHRASAVVERLLGEIATRPAGRRRGTAMVAAVSGDRHSLPTSMAAVALRDDNWFVHLLGADMPPDSILDFCGEHDITLAVITLTHTPSEETATALATRLEACGIRVVVGGPGRSLTELVRVARSGGSSSSEMSA